MMQRKSVSFRGCIIDRAEVIAQPSHGKALCNSCYTVLLTSNILHNRLPPVHTGGIHLHLLVCKREVTSTR